MTIGTHTFCPTCGARVKVRFDSVVIALHPEAFVSAHVLRLASEHMADCAKAHARKTGAAA